MNITKISFLTLSFLLSSPLLAMVSEVVYVESPTDTDRDGVKDRIYVQIRRPDSSKKLSTIFKISPYSQGGNDTDFHNTDVDLLPQDEKLKSLSRSGSTTIQKVDKHAESFLDATKYAEINADSVGTGRSTGCPTVGDMDEALAAKSVIDWLNGRARAFNANGTEVKADWANGSVGMMGTSYDGTLPIMVAATGVDGLKAIIPIAAISSWYDYYRANGLVVGPGGYIGEDADILGKFIVRKNTCKSEIQQIFQNMGREHGDFHDFWQERDYVSKAKNFKAATFIIHGQSDWNVKQKNAIQLWEALEGVVPLKMFLHKGGHMQPFAHNAGTKINAWFDYYLEGIDSPYVHGAKVEVEMRDGSLITQEEWPSEKTSSHVLYFNPENKLSDKSVSAHTASVTDSGKSTTLDDLIASSSSKSRLIFLTDALTKNRLLSGTSKVNLNFSVMNRKAANLTVALIELDKNGSARIVTRGWMDPQNYRDMSRGELLVPGKEYRISFELEPKQYQFSSGSKIGVVITSTDYDYTLRPTPGTILQFNFNQESFVDLRLSAP